MIRKKKKEGETTAEMNLTPMIDVTFLLLVFFLVQKWREPEGKLNAYLPKDKGPPDTYIVQSDPIEELTIRVRLLPGRKYPVYTIGDFDYPSIAGMEHKMRELYANDPKQPVTIDPDAKATYERVIWVLDACVRVGYSEIAFAAPIPKGKAIPGAPREPW